MTWEEIKRDWDEREAFEERFHAQESTGVWHGRKEDQIDYCWDWYDEFDRPIGQRSRRRR